MTRANYIVVDKGFDWEAEFNSIARKHQRRAMKLAKLSKVSLQVLVFYLHEQAKKRNPPVPWTIELMSLEFRNGLHRPTRTCGEDEVEEIQRLQKQGWEIKWQLPNGRFLLELDGRNVVLKDRGQQRFVDEEVSY